MLILTYDHSFEGFLTTVFDLYADCGYVKNSNLEVKIVKRGICEGELFADKIDVITDSEKAERVLTKLEKLLDKDGVQKLIWAFLSEDDVVEMCLLGVIAYAIRNPGHNVLKNYAHPEVVKLASLIKSVGRERHRMLAFVRFEKMQDGIFFARIEPDFNVLPLIVNHFRKRYQGQLWAIFDLRRNYGIYYDLKQIRPISDIDHMALTKPENYAGDELNYQKMWQGYFASVNITERSNPKLHAQQLPKRYWQYLTEKKFN